MGIGRPLVDHGDREQNAVVHTGLGVFAPRVEMGVLHLGVECKVVSVMLFCISILYT